MMETCPNCHQGDYPHGDPGEARACRAEAEIERLTAELTEAREVNQANIEAFKDDHQALVFSMAEDMAAESVSTAFSRGAEAMREAIAAEAATEFWQHTVLSTPLPTEPAKEAGNE